MGKQMKAMARPYGIVFALALVVAVLARVGLGVMDVTGTLAYDYISASGVPILDVVCSILTGSALVAFMFAAALALMVSLAGSVVQALLFARGVGGAGKAAPAFLWGWATAFVAIVCLAIVASGILSSVQVASMSSKLPGTLALVGALIVFAAFLGTLLGAASCVMCACLARACKAGEGEGAQAGAVDEGKAGRNLIIAAAVCGLVVMGLTVGTFSAINTASINLAAAGGWFAADVVVNVVIMVAAAKFAAKGAVKKA